MLNKRDRENADGYANLAIKCFEVYYEKLKTKKITTYMERYTSVNIPTDISKFIKKEEKKEYLNKLIQKRNKYYSEFDIWFDNGVLLFFNNINNDFLFYKN